MQQLAKSNQSLELKCCSCTEAFRCVMLTVQHCFVQSSVNRVSILSCNIEQILQLLNFALHIRLQTLSKFQSFIWLSIHFWDQELTYNMGLAWGWYDWRQIPFTTALVPLKHRIEFSKHWTISFFLARNCLGAEMGGSPFSQQTKQKSFGKLKPN